jgi:23S rRNA (guanine745-N1)-methyltransferase
VALADVVDALRCPHCRQPLALDTGTARCRAGHTFDVARQGHLNLLTGRTGIAGDTADMVTARADFLASGHYQPLRDAVADAVAGAGLTIEAGAGTAYYLAGVVAGTAGRTGLALDVSVYAARRAAKAHPRIGSVVADAWQELPVRDGAAEVVLDVFAPRNAAEFARILTPGGRLLVVTPASAHLAELVGELGLVRVDEAKDKRLADSLGTHFTQVDAQPLTWPMRLSHHEVGEVVAMGPSAWHTDPAALAARIATLPEVVPVTAAVTLTRWTRPPH